MSNLMDAIRDFWSRKSKQVNLESAFAGLEAKLARVNARLNLESQLQSIESQRSHAANQLDRVEAKQATSDNLLVGIDAKLDKLSASPLLAQTPGTPMGSQHLVDKFLTILTHIYSKNELAKGLDPPAYVWKQLNSFNALAQIYGQLTSMEHEHSIDGNGRPIPWYTYPAIEYLSNLDFSQKRVFEYGSGNSSLWWAGRCCEIVAIESDRAWYEKVNSARAGGRIRDYRLCEDVESYVNHRDIVNSNIVIIDGTFRICCAAFFLSKIAESNNFELLIWDNADWQPDVIEILSQKLPDWVQVDFHGFGPINDYTWTTTMFVNSKVKQRYAKNISSMYAVHSLHERVSEFKDNNYVAEYLLK